MLEHPGLLAITDVDLHAPEALGRGDMILGGGRILALGQHLELPARLGKTFRGDGLIAVPGFIDGHVHLLGGGGEGGYETRTPELPFSDAVRAGITTLVGCLGTDGIGRSLEALLAKACALERQGLSTFIYSGSYAIPPITLTGSVERDLMLIDKVIGTGEVALSDHRSSQPSFREFLRLVAENRRGGMLAGKAGVVNLHLGDGPQGLEFLRRMLTETELPITQVWPTHVNRNPALFQEAIALGRLGGFVDITTSGVPQFYATGTVPPALALRQMLEAGVPEDRITFTSDGQGSLPCFAEDGSLEGLTVGGVDSLAQYFREAVLEEGLPLARALAPVTRNPAQVLKLQDRGRLQVGLRADLQLLDPQSLEPVMVVAGGRILMEGGTQRVFAPFEKDSRP